MDFCDNDDAMESVSKVVSSFKQSAKQFAFSAWRELSVPSSYWRKDRHVPSSFWVSMRPTKRFGSFSRQCCLCSPVDLEVVEAFAKDPNHYSLRFSYTVAFQLPALVTVFALAFEGQSWGLKPFVESLCGCYCFCGCYRSDVASSCLAFSHFEHLCHCLVARDYSTYIWARPLKASVSGSCCWDRASHCPQLLQNCWFLHLPIASIERKKGRNFLMTKSWRRC